MRLHGRGTVVCPGDDAWEALIGRFTPNPGARAIVLVTVERVSTSCGFSVPLTDYRADRDVLDRWAAHKGADGLTEYRALKNARSIDGLPALAATESD